MLYIPGDLLLLFVCLFILVVLGVELGLARQSLFHFSHTSSFFCFGFFETESALCPDSGLGCDSPIYTSYRSASPCPAFHWLRWGACNFLPDPSDLCLPSSWDYSLALLLIFKKEEMD
jgi:hypothetical protein